MKGLLRHVCISFADATYSRWLSPELYLRRPPAKNEKYRLDKLLFAAAKRGVKINIIIYKEVTQALTLSSSHTKHW